MIKMRLFLACVIFLVINTMFSAAQAKPLIALLPFTTNEVVFENDAHSLTGLFETALRYTGAFTIITQRHLMTLFASQETLKECAEVDCAVRIGQLLKVDYIILGTVGKSVDTYFMVVQVIEVETGKIKDTEDALAGSKDKLQEKIYLITSKLVDLCSGNSKLVLDDFVLVEAGTYQRGSLSGEEDEKPVHRVTISKAFYMKRHEVTFEEYDEFCRKTDRSQPNDEGWGRTQRPVINVSWYDAVEYCNWLSIIKGLSPAYKMNGKSVTWDLSTNGYRLPAEAEWEFAALGGNKSRGYNYSGSDSVGEAGWYRNNSGSKTHPVGQKESNELGLCDMSGNVWEWCWDWKGKYFSSSQTNPIGPSAGTARIIRGGRWGNYATRLRPANRGSRNPDYSYYGLGFRVVITAE